MDLFEITADIGIILMAIPLAFGVGFMVVLFWLALRTPRHERRLHVRCPACGEDHYVAGWFTFWRQGPTGAPALTSEALGLHCDQCGVNLTLPLVEHPWMQDAKEQFWRAHDRAQAVGAFHGR